MKNNFKNLIYQNWHWLVFFILAFLSLSFLIFQSGVWAFTDSGFYYQNILQTKRIALSKLGQFATTDGFYFGFDNSVAAFSHLIISWYQFALTFIFGAYLGQILFYFVYYFLTFYFGLRLLKKLFPDSKDLAIRVGALFLTFNPFSLLILTLFTISYIYPACIVFLFNFLTFLEKGKIKNLTVSVFFGIYLLSYFRLIPIVAALILAVFWLFYDKNYFNQRRWLIFIIVMGLCASPFILSNLPLVNNSDNILASYQTAFSKYDLANYNFKQSFINTFSHPGGFTPSALSFFYNNRGLPGFADNFAVKDSFEFYKALQIIFNVGLLLFALVVFKNKKILKIIGLICGVFLINTLGLFVNPHVFSIIHKTILVFLYNDYGFIQFIQSFLYTFLIVILVHLLGADNKLRKNLPIFLLVLWAYIFINITPFLLGHYGFKKVDQMPNNYQEKIFVNQPYQFSEATLFAPYHWLKFSWAPYYLDLNSAYSPYQSLIVPNLRLISNEFVKFYNQIYDNFDRPEISNISIFNIKNIFLFHDVADANDRIDAYQVTDIEYKSKKIDSELRQADNFVIVSDNQNFTHYRFKEADNYDFLIYSPKSLLNLYLDNFYDEKFDLNQKPVLFDKNELNSINILRDVDFFVNSPHVSYKVSAYNPNKYYVKLNVIKDQPFLLQFNQMYSGNWRVYFISKSEWETIRCFGVWQSFSLTENSRCSYDGLPLDLNDLKLLTKKYLKPDNHFKGNIIGNSFLFTPEDIPSEYEKNDDLYLIIYFNKQVYYLISLIVASLTFLLLIISSLLEYLPKDKKKIKV